MLLYIFHAYWVDSDTTRWKSYNIPTVY